MRSVFITYISLLLFFFAVAPEEIATAQGNNNPVPITDSVWRPSPRKAVLYAATFPGLGQIYNRKYWKVPVVYVGFAAVGYFIWFNNSRYNSYKNGYLDFTDTDPETASYLDLIGPGLDPATFDNVLFPNSTTYSKQSHDWFEGQLKNLMDYYHRYRDLSFIAGAGWYLITTLDAVVDAQLFDYDISEDLSLHILPVSRPVGGQGVLGFTCSLQF